MKRRDFTPEAFRAWLTRSEMSERKLAEIFGCSRGTIQRYKENGAPYHIGLACAAIDANLEPPEAPPIDAEAFA